MIETYLGEYKLNGFTFKIVETKNKKIGLRKLKEGNIINKISNIEWSLFVTILKSISFSKEDSVYLYKKSVNGKIYKIFYDYKTKNYWWMLLQSSSKSLIQDNSMLNYWYNNHTCIVKKLNEETETLISDDLFINRIVSFFSRDIHVKFLARRYPRIDKNVIEFLLDCPGKSFPDKFSDYLVEANQIARRKLYGKKHTIYDWDYFEDLIEKNEKIPIEDKEILKEYKIIYDKYGRLLNHHIIAERLKLLRVEFNESKNTSQEGAFKPFENKIIYKGKLNALTRFHECGHIYQQSYENYAFEYAHEIMCRELRRTGQNLELMIEEMKDVGYSGPDSIYYVLMNLLDLETRVKFWARGRRAILEEFFKRYDGDNLSEHGNAYKLMTLLNEMKIGNQSVYMSCYIKILKLLSNYYKKIKGEDITENLVLFMLLNSDYTGNIILSGMPKYDEKLKNAYKILFGENYNSSNISKSAVIPHSYYEINDMPDYFVCWNQKNNISVVEITEEQIKKYKEQVKRIHKSDIEQVISL